MNKKLQPKFKKQLTINRQKWGKYALLNKDGTMCCLGFLCKQYGADGRVYDYNDYDYGFPKFAIYGCAFPSENKNLLKLLPKELKKSQKFFEKAADINDEKSDDEQREDKLRKLFRKKGITLRFVG